MFGFLFGGKKAKQSSSSSTPAVDPSQGTDEADLPTGPARGPLLFVLPEVTQLGLGPPAIHLLSFAMVSLSDGGDMHRVMFPQGKFDLKALSYGSVLAGVVSLAEAGREFRAVHGKVDPMQQRCLARLLEGGPKTSALGQRIALAINLVLAAAEAQWTVLGARDPLSGWETSSSAASRALSTAARRACRGISSACGVNVT